MVHTAHNKIVSFIWSIADGCLRDAYKMAQSGVLHDVIGKFIAEKINLGPDDRKGPDDRTQPGPSNLGTGYVSEKLIRKFNEENNEDAGKPRRTVC